MKLRNFLRMHRRRWHFSQQELAFLLGYLDQSMIARLEQDERTVTIASAHTCELVFGVKPRELFPDLYEEIENDISTRMCAMRDRLHQSAPTEKTLTKLKLVEEALRKIASANQET